VVEAGMATTAPDFISYLPERVWYLTASGRELWCRRPYTFFFSSSEAALAFAAKMGTAFELQPIGVSSKELVDATSVEALRRQQISRIFLDPQFDDATGDVFGKILRLEAEAAQT